MELFSISIYIPLYSRESGNLTGDVMIEVKGEPQKPSADFRVLLFVIGVTTAISLFAFPQMDDSLSLEMAFGYSLIIGAVFSLAIWLLIHDTRSWIFRLDNDTLTLTGFKEHTMGFEEIETIYFTLELDEEGEKINKVELLLIKPIWRFFAFYFTDFGYFTQTQLRTICCALLGQESLREKFSASSRLCKPWSPEQDLEQERLIELLRSFCQDE